jgi:ABC-type bacteriocin/lantibiotic exporter with double-glycine peptidase domain
MRNFCGPAALTSVLKYWGVDTDQKTVGKAVFDTNLQATNGADMMLYARKKGFSAYSWNSSMLDLKSKLALGVPVIVLQDSAINDKSGHYRVATGFDDAAKVVYVNDPYEPENKAMDYTTFETLWQRHGYWSLLVCPTDRDWFKDELDKNNPVVHLDLAYVYYMRGDAESAERESRLALALEPYNYSAQDLLNKSTRALGARSKAKEKASK